MILCLLNPIHDQTILNAFGAAIGGFLGVVLFFCVRLVIEQFRTRPITVRSYSCAHDQNVGDPHEYEGQLMHHHGRRITDVADLQKITKTKPVWEWSTTPCGKDEGTSVIYGPYTTDFSEPGEYEVLFRIRAFGMAKKSELNHDPIVLELDVTRTTPDYLAAPNGIQQFGAIVTVCRHFVRASDLAESRWVDFPLRFYATGEGVWEYRVHAFDGVSKSPNNIAHFGGSLRLFFDSITIRRLRKMVLPWD